MIVLFASCAVVIIVYAAGYKIDIQNRNITKTSLINVQVDPPDSEVYLSGKLIGTGSQTIRNVDPGKYVLEVKKTDYYTFTKNIDAQEGQAVIVSGAQLFLKKPIVGKPKSEFSKDDLLSLSDNDNLTSKDGELRFKGELVTRLSQEISALSWFPSRQYISFTNDSKLKLICVDGTNMIDLIEKDSTTPAIFIKSGRSVIYENQNEIFEAKIR